MTEPVIKSQPVSTATRATDHEQPKMVEIPVADFLAAMAAAVNGDV